MSYFFQKIIALSKRLIFVILLIAISRSLLYLFNKNLFFDVDVNIFVKYFFYGFRFDIASVLATNSLLIILYILPFGFSYSKLYQRLLNLLFIFVNSINIIANLSDIIYFRFTLKRTTAEFVSMFKEDSNMFKLLPTFFIDYWYITVLGIIFIALLFIATRKTNYSIPNTKVSTFNFKWASALVSTLLIGLVVLGIRGGTQLRPISIIDATKYASSDEVALVLNTPFTLMKTVGKTKLPLYDFFNNEELNRVIATNHNYKRNKEFRDLNVVVIIMESMSKEHSAYFNPNLRGNGFTPFLDTLMKHSLVCKHAYANGRKSIEGIPAVVASFPSFLNNAFISSNYSSNRLTGLASLLNAKGYKTAFYHGGNNGTMGFDNFTKAIGYQSYYGRDEYANDDDFDGLWGIFDDKFFKFFGEKLTQSKQPFFATIFSLSAHHPYTIPERYNGKFPKGRIPIQQAMAYSDFALSQFFTYAKTQEWFSNTIFVITADHTSEIADPDFNNPAGKYAIPIIYYMPSDSLIGEINSTTQQIDILPSVLDYLNYDKDFYSLGNSIFSKENDFSLSFNNGIYQIINSDSLLQFNPDNNTFTAYSLNQWRLFKLDSLISEPKSIRKKVKAFIQKYNYDLVNDKMN
jgi:phosphoglycerol transferase MdoB-like AlkP superfamily enzyme